MGKVLIYYESMRACRHFINNEDDQKAVCAAVFDSPEWVLLDMGVISEEEGFRKNCAPGCRSVFMRQQSSALTTGTNTACGKIEEMEALVRELKAKGLWPLCLFQRIYPPSILL